MMAICDYADRHLPFFQCAQYTTVAGGEIAAEQIPGWLNRQLTESAIVANFYYLGESRRGMAMESYCHLE